MPLIPINQSLWAVAVIVLSIAMGVLAIAVIWSFERRRSRIPDATRYEDLKERAAAIEVRILEHEDQLRQIDQKIHDRDRIAAEVAALTERLENLRVERDALAGAEQQIEAMKERAAEAAATYATEMTKLDQVKLNLEETASNLTEAQDRIDGLKRDAEALEAQNKALRETLPEEIENLRAQRDELNKEKSAIVEEVSQLRSSRDALFAAREETSFLAVRNDLLEVRYRELREELPLEIERLNAERNTLRSEVDSLAEEISRLKGTRESLLSARDEVLTLTAKVDELNARRVALEEDIVRMRGEEISGAHTRPDLETVAADLEQTPPCLISEPVGEYPAQLEEDALHDVAEYLGALGLHYDRRTIYAFHTALKINDTSQMTILAGVSGTGKSLLPRRYAEAMGMRFLQIAVEPRWDSPQDLLGFYNYIEKHYRATELARALVQMDPYNTSGLSDLKHKDEIMLVLLDEMNLARVEYYFSEFLSRLEVRPRLDDAAKLELRLGACLPIDVPGRAEGPIRLFPSHNVLFTGTMNDDESTQSLSDKVLDRSNVMQFAAPERFARPLDAPRPAAMNRFRSFQAWRKWVSKPDQMANSERQKADRVIGTLARIMSDCGRPFGHRLNEAILAYVVNYPRSKGVSVDVPLVDQIELRIMPKLRGLAIEDHQQAFDNLVRLIDGELADSALAGQLGELVSRQRDGNGQFNWRGFNRGLA